ncbi:MAG: hypothetical protein J6X38_03155 [Abditibacteriota bacterium]|nr:hypothetical protein [Abditibacteriota bacterium]
MTNTIPLAIPALLLATAAFAVVDGGIPAKNASDVKTVKVNADTAGKSPAVISGLDIIPAKGGVKVTAGKCKIGGKVVTVKTDTILPVAHGDAVTVVDEPIKVPVCEPSGYWNGARLKGPDGNDTNCQFAYNSGTAVLRKEPGGKPLVLGKDFTVSDPFALLGLTADSAASPDETLYVSYIYSLLRIDSVFVTPEGKIALAKGKPSVNLPEQPKAKPGCLRLANIYIPYRSVSVKPEDIYPVVEGADKAKTLSRQGNLAKTMAKIKSGQPVTIVCWGDSVTQGGNASTPDMVYVKVFERMLKAKFPKADITVINESVGGSSSLNWLRPDKYPFQGNGFCDFEQRVAVHNPDLVTMEFVNDSGYTPEMLDEAYTDIKARMDRLGAEYILITPHFTTPYWMGFDDMRAAKENRSYVFYALDWAEKNGYGIADASSRWAHLGKEGIPYITLLGNTLNHPNDYGHNIFAEELMKCFK